MSPFLLIKTLVLVAILGYLAIPEAEARTLEQQVNAAPMQELQLGSSAQQIPVQGPIANLDQNESDADEDEDEDLSLQIQNPVTAAGSAYAQYNAPIQTAQTLQKYHATPSAADLKTSASHHHHGHGVKGWLDMGAWTGKKGAFGWYDKHPVGKGK